MPDEAGGIFPPEDEENTQPQEGGKGGTSSKIMMIVVVAAAIVLAFAVSNFVVKPMLTKNKTAQVSDQPADKEEKKGSSSHDSHGSAEGESGDENFFKVEGIIVNPAATGGSRYLSTTIGFELEDPGSMEAFKSREIKIRDALISILSSKTVAELSNAESREMIRRQILKYINQICQPSKADAVYFVDFVLQ